MFVPGGQIFVTQSRGGRGQTFLQPVGRGVTNIWLWWWQWQGGGGFVVGGDYDNDDGRGGGGNYFGHTGGTNTF